MREAFDVMGDHPWVTFFIGFIIMVFISQIADIFKQKKHKENGDS